MFPVIVGPTAGGKSAVALALVEQLRARGIGSEIVSADAFQVYRGLDIGTAKPTPDEQAAAPHHLIDIRDPRDAFTVDDWLRLAEEKIAEIRGKSSVPIVVGGTHLYIKALLEGLFESPVPDPDLRAQLQMLANDELHAELRRVDPAAADRIHPNDRRRVIRAIEVHRQMGAPISELQQQWDRSRRTDALLVALMWPTEAINRRINARVRDMMERGLLEEVRSLWSAEALGEQAREGIGYKQLIAHLEGRCSLDDAVEQIKIETRRFAKNQRTWLRRLLVAPPGAPRPLALEAEGRSAEELAAAVLAELGIGLNAGHTL